MDVYDPAFEQDFNAITDTSLSTASGEDFWFTTDGQVTTTNSSTGIANPELLNLIKNQVIKKQ
jgi:hypothetical protein